MANGLSGRPKAAELANRCTASNAHGGRCGNPSMAGAAICTLHLGRADPKKVVALSDRLLALGHKALDALEWAVDHVQEHPAEGVRASGILMDRVLPKPGATQAVYVRIGNDAHGDGTVRESPGDVIRGRLREITQAHEERQRREREERAWDSEIVDAEIVTEDEHEPS